MSVDYFEVNSDYKGFRKKVTPNLDGTFKITDHETPFTLEIDNEKPFKLIATESFCACKKCPAQIK